MNPLWITHVEADRPVSLNAGIRCRTACSAAALIALVCGLVWIPGCRTLPLDPEARPPTPVPSSLTASLDALRLQAASTISEDGMYSPDTHTAAPLFQRYSHRAWRVEMEPPVRLFDDQVLRIDIFEPTESDAPRPLILVLPILSGGYSIAEHFASHCARQGFNAAIIHREARYKDVDDDVEQLNRVFEQMIIDHEVALDWLLSEGDDRPNVDPNRVGVFGISAGAIQASLVYAIDDRIRAAVLALPGGDLAHVLAYSPERGIARRRAAALERHSITADELYESLHESFRYDPIDFAPHMDAANAMLIVARFDAVIPYRLGMALREAMGGPETIIIPSGHYSAIVYVPVIEHRMIRFFKRALDWSPLRYGHD